MFSKKEFKSREKRSGKILEYKTYTADSDLEEKNYYKESEFDNTYITESDLKEVRFTEKINLPAITGPLPNILKNQPSYITSDDFNHQESDYDSEYEIIFENDDNDEKTL